MQIKQFEDKNLSHFSYAILSDCEKKVVLIDPARDPQQYYDYAKTNGAEIIGVIETHPHADFASSHFEISKKTGAPVYVSKLVGVSYPHTPFDEGDTIGFGKIILKALNTPGHSPDSISILLEHDGKQKAVFTGDTLFIGDVGRPDLREGAGNLQVSRNELAKQMYYSLRDKLSVLNNDITVYPAHGAGSLCGKALSGALTSTLGAEKMTNWAFQDQTETEFTKELLKEQPFVPVYFPYDVELNRKGAPDFEPSVSAVKITSDINGKDDESRLDMNFRVVDTRPAEDFRKGHVPNSFNIHNGGKFETWLGSIVRPGERFYLAASDKETLSNLVKRAASIGYESSIVEAFVLKNGSAKEEDLDLEDFKTNPEKYTILDVRNEPEVAKGKTFGSSINIPLPALRDRIKEVPLDKPVVVHCAAGMRSAAGSSILQSAIGDKVKIMDLSEDVKKFQDQKEIA